MAVLISSSTLPGGVTPVCDRCGIRLCWDLSEADYRADQPFWDGWICQDCNGGQALSLSAWRQERTTGLDLDRPGWNRISELGRLL